MRASRSLRAYGTSSWGEQEEGCGIDGARLSVAAARSLLKVRRGEVSPSSLSMVGGAALRALPAGARDSVAEGSGSWSVWVGEPSRAESEDAVFGSAGG